MSEPKIFSLFTTTKQSMERIVKRGEEPEYPLLTLPMFSKKMWGLEPGLTVLGARTSQGKSALALQIAFDLADQGKRAWYISLEMSRLALCERLICNVMKINNMDLRKGLGKHYLKKLKAFYDLSQRLPLIIDDQSGKNFQEVYDFICRSQKKPQVLVLDYIQSVRQDDTRTERETINEYLRRLRKLCHDEGIVGIVVSQINRRAEQKDHTPTMSMLKGTGVLEEHADTVLLLHWDWFYDRTKDMNKIQLIVAKNRDGLCFTHTLDFEPPNYLFRESLPEAMPVMSLSEVQDKIEKGELQ